jgi:PKD repeat protein
LTVEFRSSAQGGTGIHDYSWNFGDGGSSGNPNPRHTYDAAGTFTARVTVTSGGQSRTCERDITVTSTAPPPYPGPAMVRRITWLSELDVPGGRGQVVFHGQGASASYPGPGTAHGIAYLPEPHVALGDWDAAPTVRVEAQLVDAREQAGTWRFELDPGAKAALVQPGSLRVVAGTVAEVQPTAVTFRVNGQPGERVVFTFRSW